MSNRNTLSTTKKNKVKRLLKTLILIIQNTSNNPQKLGHLSGLSGELLFLWQVSQYDKTLIDETVFSEKLIFLQDHLATVATKFNISAGLAGLGWFFEYLNQMQQEDYDAELCEDIDDILLTTLSVDSWSGEIEMVLGLAGLSIYGARRQLKSEQTVFYEKFIQHFETLATRLSDNTLAWQQPKQSLYRLNKNNLEQPEYNLGLAHGIPGIIAAILPALKNPSLHSRTKKLLIQSCDWLLQQQLDITDSNSYFSSSADSKHSSRLGWCYGDLPIALTLYRVGIALDSPTYMDKARDISLHAASRDEISGIVDDAGLCHGSAGLALVFQLLYQEIGAAELQQASEKWLDFTLKFYDEKGLPGLHKFTGIGNNYVESTGFLEAYAGIGLCLLVALNGETDWTDCLLLS